ncbi:MAG: hypothetical protein ACLQQ4_16830 [Bacteroidia bacterium]
MLRPERAFPISYFIETKAPEINSSDWRKLNHSKFDFNVTNIDDRLVLTRGPRGTRCELKLADGKLVGTDNGEHGGKLIFKPIDKTKTATEIKRGNIKFIFKLQDVIYFIERIDSSGIGEGAMYRVDIVNNAFSFTKILGFEDAPEAYAIYKGDLLIASYRNFYVVHDLKMDVFLKDTFWEGLFPTSIAVLDERHVYIGLRSGYAQLDLTNKNLRFYKYSVIS